LLGCLKQLNASKENCVDDESFEIEKNTTKRLLIKDNNNNDDIDNDLIDSSSSDDDETDIKHGAVRFGESDGYHVSSFPRRE